MAIPTAFTSDMLREMVRDMGKIGDASTMKSLLVSRGARKQIEAEFRANAPTLTDNPILSGFMQTYMGLPVETFDIPPEEVLDWSGCRSPSRAKRRHARGIPQRVKVEYRERAFLVDRRALGMRLDRMMVDAMYGTSKR